MLDVIEIDGASNNGVENVRDLIEKARFEPNQWKYKVYIIDEVHMLSTGAFNALLKTLEEPPAHVKFILATTEIEKVPETIRSRSLRFDFRKASEDDIFTLLWRICQLEKITIDSEEALKVISKAARWGFRDALTLLEQNTVNWLVSTEYVRSTLALIEESLIQDLITHMKSGDIASIQKILEVLKTRHIQVRGLFDQIMYALRDLLVAHISDNANFIDYNSIMKVFEDAYGKVKVIPDGMLLVELTLIRATKRGILATQTLSSPSIAQTPPVKIAPQKPEPVQEEKKIQTKAELPKTLSAEIPTPKIQEVVASEAKKEEMSTPQKENFSFLTLLHTLKTTKPALVVDLKTARYEVAENILKLIFIKNWNFGRVNTAQVKNTLSEILNEKFWGSWQVECILQESNTAWDIGDDVF
jgi:DNA polymerase III subunit gamma/tau